MNLVSFSIRTKGVRTFARRLYTVFSRFGFSEKQTRHALLTITDLVRQYNGAPTFFIPAVVLQRHPSLLAEVARHGAEIGVHGYVHNDYRSLQQTAQHTQTKDAIEVFRKCQMAYQGVRNPYLGWTDESAPIYEALGFAYESNEAVLHDVIAIDQLPATLRANYERSLALYRVMECNAYTLRPHFEGKLVRIPLSMPDDEMLYDRLQMTSEDEIGRIWGKVMRRVYALEGVYTLNLHPERAQLCKKSLAILLSTAQGLERPVWITRLDEIAQWWRERSQFRIQLSEHGPSQWKVEAECSERAVLLGRNVTTADASPWSEQEVRLPTTCVVEATRCPCIGLSQQSPQDVSDFLHEQGYPYVRCAKEDADRYALTLDIPTGMGNTRSEQVKQGSAIVQQVQQLTTPLLRFHCWPDGQQAALSITGDIDSVTIQDFFLRILEVRNNA